MDYLCWGVVAIGGLSPSMIYGQAVEGCDGVQFANTLVVQHETYPGAKDGAIDVTINGGEAPYTYAWTVNNESFADTEDLTGLEGGVYVLQLTDANGCTAYFTYEVGVGDFQEFCQNSDLSATVESIEDEGMQTQVNGAIAVEVSGGTAPYTYYWTGPDGFIATEEDLLGLSAGEYRLEVTDANGCSVALSAFVKSSLCETLVSMRAKVRTLYKKGNWTLSLATPLPSGVEATWFDAAGIKRVGSAIRGMQAGEYVLMLTNQFGCSSYFTYKLDYENTQEEETESQSIAAYPNPSHGEFSIQVPSFHSSARLLVMSMTGQVVYEATSPLLKIKQENGLPIKIRGLRKGVYLLRFTYDAQEVTEKVYVN
ncbi:hypothetical protein GCM10023331_23360 [Algivirga pacifica]|uniref:Secretion system C-terminal sorting domain-containing protein n=2 Tax=Algivirga pacifica TaxID=1162670 RepID=A0ABP9DEM2_9BACT